MFRRECAADDFFVQKSADLGSFSLAGTTSALRLRVPFRVGEYYEPSAPWAKLFSKSMVHRFHPTVRGTYRGMLHADMEIPEVFRYGRSVATP